MKYTIIEKDGEQQFVKSLTGIGPEWTIIGESEEPPGLFEKWDKNAGKLRVTNPAAKIAHERRAKARDPEYLLNMIEELQARVAELENKVAP